MSRIQAQSRMQRANPRINTYSTSAPTPESLQVIPGLSHGTTAFGAYMPDSDAAEKARDFYETLDAVAEVSAPNKKDETVGRVQRVAPITEREIDLVRAAKEANLKMKNDQYWTSQIDPALPWTLTEVTKVRPDILEKRLNAIKQLSQYTLDYEILRHLGHGGDPRLAELQYMIDQGMMDHMPKSTLVQNPKQEFKAGPYSIFGLIGAGTDAGNNGKFKDNGLYLARTNIDPRYLAMAQNLRPRIQGDGHTLKDTFKGLRMPSYEQARTLGM